MATVFKIRVTRYIDEKGRQVKKGIPGARVRRTKSKKWYGQYKDESGTLQRVALSTDRAAAQTQLNERVKHVARRLAGLFDEFEEHERRTVGEHVGDYRKFLLGKGGTEGHVEQTVERIKKLVAGCEFTRLSNMNAPAVVEWPIESSPRRKTLLGADKQLLPGRGKVILCLVGRASPDSQKPPRLTEAAQRRS